MDKPKNLIKIRDIKNLLIKGTNVKYQHGDFAKRLLVDGSLLLSSEEFDNDIVGSSVFSSFVGGNLRQLNNGKWGYAIVGVTERLERLNLEYEDEYDECYIYVCFYNAFKNNILPHLKIEISKESDYDAYLMLVYKKISELVKKENTYYLELYDDITNMIVNKELYKALALLCMISIFQDKVCLFFSDKYRTRWSDKGFFPFQSEIESTSNTFNSEETTHTYPIPLSTIDFFETVLSDESELGKISSIDMAFHGGSLWLYDGRKNAILKKAIERGIKIRIIINTSLQVDTIASHMRQPGLMYTGFDKNASDWCHFMAEHIDNVEVRIAQIPLLRRTYIVKGECSKGWANVTYYSYGNFDISNDQRLCFHSGDNAYRVYMNEYNYIWDNASELYSELVAEKYEEIPKDTASMVEKALSDNAPLGKVTSIDMASHSGLLWLTDTKYVDNFLKAINHDVKFRIIVNTSSFDKSAKHMRQPIKKYPGFDQCLIEWLEREKMYPELIEVRVAEVPLFHCTHIIKGENGNGWIRVRYYTYGNYDISKDQRLCLKNTDEAYRLYLDEFEYIWELSVRASEYIKRMHSDITN